MNPYIVDPMLKYVAFDTLVLVRLDPSLCLFLILFFETRASYCGGIYRYQYSGLT